MKAGGGELNFATADDKMAMTVFVPPEFMYALWEKQCPCIEIAGLGDEAFSMGAGVRHHRSYFVNVKQVYGFNR